MIENIIIFSIGMFLGISITFFSFGWMCFCERKKVLQETKKSGLDLYL
jgi:hypothetical protein